MRSWTIPRTYDYHVIYHGKSSWLVYHGPLSSATWLRQHFQILKVNALLHYLYCKQLHSEPKCMRECSHNDMQHSWTYTSTCTWVWWFYSTWTFLISTSPKPPFGTINITSARKYHIKIAKLKGEELELEKECVISTNLKLDILEFYMYTVLKVQVYQVIHIHMWISQVSEASRIFAIEMVGGWPMRL